MLLSLEKNQNNIAYNLKKAHTTINTKLNLKTTYIYKHLNQKLNKSTYKQIQIAFLYLKIKIKIFWEKSRKAPKGEIFHTRALHSPAWKERFLVIPTVNVAFRKGSIHGSIHFVETCGGWLWLLSHSYRHISVVRWRGLKNMKRKVDWDFYWEKEKVLKRRRYDYIEKIWSDRWEKLCFGWKSWLVRSIKWWHAKWDKKEDFSWYIWNFLSK